ncbi:MAG: hypothetical protein KQH67_12715 [Bacteroidetes bacterium]|nr:hypothetical protein [Bacteroidota bacterium]
MKNILLLFAAVLVIISCQKPIPIENEKVTDLGLSSFKYGEIEHTLFGGQTIPVGSVTIGVTEDGLNNIYIKFETDPGWYIKETHVFVGPEGSSVPVNKPGNPKIGHFPFGTDHQYGDGTTMVTYPTIPYVINSAFVVATHAVVYSDDGQEETAWAYNEANSTRFSGKRWGWFQSYTWDGQLPAQCNLLYITQYDVNGILHIFQVNLGSGEVIEISQEEFLAGLGSELDGSAWDPLTNQFYFVSESGNELWISDFDEDVPSNLVGALEGIAIDGTYLGNTYYYVDANNQIWSVTFDDDMNMAQSQVGSLTADMDIIDIAANPDGQGLYFVVNNNGTSELIKYDLYSGASSLVAILGTNMFQIAFDEDGELHAIEQTPEEDNSVVHDVNENTGEIDNSMDVDVDVEDVVTGPRI